MGGWFSPWLFAFLCASTYALSGMFPALIQISEKISVLVFLSVFWMMATIPFLMIGVEHNRGKYVSACEQAGGAVVGGGRGGKKACVSLGQIIPINTHPASIEPE